MDGKIKKKEKSTIEKESTFHLFQSQFQPLLFLPISAPCGCISGSIEDTQVNENYSYFFKDSMKILKWVQKIFKHVCPSKCSKSANNKLSPEMVHENG